MRPLDAPRMRVLAISSNKGGVGKTTVAANLAIYLRALREDLPVLVVGLDDQNTIDRMFALSPLEPGTENLKHGWARRSLARVIQLGQYGVHFVPSPPDTALLKGRAEDPRTLRRILDRSEWEGVVILDTKSDLEALTANALFAADRVIVPVADRASLVEAGKLFRMLERAQLDPDKARILFTLVDRRSRGTLEGSDLLHLLAGEIERRGWPRYRTFLARSPRVESLISARGRPQSILHHAKGTAVHRQMRGLAEEVLADLGLGDKGAGDGARAAAAAVVPGGSRAPSAAGARSDSVDWKAALLRGVWRRPD
ncbi:MAG: ParA family protein [Proteobacteria bacterium]|nr:ParA family protein [Pseudomonadota bacterium]